ncbi:MAG: T9SS type A sorting domain-containing protein [Saprospiraceae bacterium]
MIFYTNGCQIINREHAVMTNGDEINPGNVHNNYCSDGLGYPYRQGMMTLPFPDSDSLYYLFHIRINAQLYPTDLLYSVVNANGDNGLGEVTEKNTLLFQDTFADQLQAVRHGNGRDWWVVVPKVGSNIHYLFLLSPQGVEGPFLQQVGTPWNQVYWSGQAIFSPDGSKYIRVNPLNGIHIFDFDRCSGELFNPIKLEFVGETVTGGGAGVSVSPNNRYLYVSLSTKFYQYDLWAADIGASRQLIAVYDGFLSFLPTTFFQHMLAPDGKIYITSTNAVNRLHVIHNPNEPGTACNLEQHGIRLPTFHAFAAPNFPHFRLYDLPGSPCDTLGISTANEEPERQEAGIKVFPNPADGVAYIQLPPGVVGKLQVWNTEGKVMYDQEIEANAGQRLVVNTAQWPAGVYFCTFYDNKGWNERRVTFVVSH